MPRRCGKPRCWKPGWPAHGCGCGNSKIATSFPNPFPVTPAKAGGHLPSAALAAQSGDGCQPSLAGRVTEPVPKLFLPIGIESPDWAETISHHLPDAIHQGDEP